MAFREVRIGDYFRFSKGLGYLGKYLESSNVGLIGLNSFEAGGGYKFGGEKPYSGPYKEQHRAHPGDLFIATTDITQDGRVLGSPFLLPYDISDYESFIFSGDIVKGEPITQEFTAEYLFNILRVKNVREKIAYASTGTTVRRVPLDVVENVWVSIPTPAIQRIICLILSSIDEKIRVNQQITSTLEQIAQTIFKSWFVDFDPVHAKARGEQPLGMHAQTAALFPDSFEECELGPIPCGWKTGNISELGRIATGKTPSTKVDDYWNGDVPFVTIPDLHKGSLVIEAARYLTHKGTESQKSQNIPSGSTMVSCIATAGLVGFAVNSCQTNQQINSIIPRDFESREWVFNCMLNLRPILRNESSIGTVFANLSKSGFSQIRIIMPPKQLMFAYSELIRTFIELATQREIETKTLISLRDSLLPRLISGELEIPAELLEA